MGVGAPDEPIENERFDECENVFLRVSRVLAQKFRNGASAGAAFVFVFARWMDSQRLTDVFLMDADDAARRNESMVERCTTMAISSSNRWICERATGRPSSAARTRQKCSFSACPSSSGVPGLRMCVVGAPRRHATACRQIGARFSVAHLPG